MGTAAFSLHDDRPALLREGDALHRDMEGGMKSKRYAYSQTGLERAIRSIPRTPPRIGALWMDGKMIRCQESTHLTRSGAMHNKLIRLHRRES
jgi:hypothetical protein